MILRSLIVLSGLCLAPALAGATTHLVEPRLTIAPGRHHGPRVALTLDACTGAADERILHALIDNRIPVTIFATARWLQRNPAALAEIRANPALFEVENHGARHQPAVDVPMSVYGIAAAGSPAAVKAEVDDGAAAVTAATGRKPQWFRGATGKYSATAMTEIAATSERIAGYSLIADGGARLGETATRQNIAGAQDGDVIIAHVNQPTRPAGAGVVAGVLALKARGFVFVRLEDAKLAAPAN
jgi:peptidoglycan/xylan/chitin deacetylase (PgdA/CDA1 family)